MRQLEPGRRNPGPTKSQEMMTMTATVKAPKEIMRRAEDAKSDKKRSADADR